MQILAQVLLDVFVSQIFNDKLLLHNNLEHKKMASLGIDLSFSFLVAWC